MALKLLWPPPPSPSSSALSRPNSFFFSSTFVSSPTPVSRTLDHLFQRRSKKQGLRRRPVSACLKVEQQQGAATATNQWGKVSAVLFDMDGVLCNSEEPSRMAAVDVFAEMGVQVTVDDFVPFTGTGEINFLGGVANAKGVDGFDPEAAKKRFFEIYLDKYAKPESGIGFPGALELVTQCKSKGLKVAVASSADRIKVNANLAAAGLPISMFDAIVSADAFENLKPAPDIFLAASRILDVPPSECLVIEDALAGVQAAQAANMRCIAVTTTMSEEAMKNAGPSLIRSQIGSVSLEDILSGGSDSYNEKMQQPQVLQFSVQKSEAVVTDRMQNSPILNEEIAISDKVSSTGGLQGSRREIIRYGSLGIALSCLYFAVSNWKMCPYRQCNMHPLKRYGTCCLESTVLLLKRVKVQLQLAVGTPRFSRVQQFVKYISDLEARGSTTTVPEFPSKLDWLNTAPLQFRRDLKGKVVLLDFWTYCCINCMHVLPDLEFLERKYKDMPFTVVGVHSAKFDNEKDLEAIRNAVLRYNISHPVVNDGEMYLWRELGINSWPTFAIVGPNGKLLAQVAGEGHRQDLDDLVEAALLYYGKKKILDKTPIPLNLEKNRDQRFYNSPLKFPGKLAIDVLNNRLFISDSNHNRIVITDLDGNFILQVGSTGEEGLRDGSFETAAFNRPQGLAYNPKKNLLYVADTENHALREINLVDDTVLNSPWDVCFEPVNEKVYIAMAGQHQIWEHDTMDGVTKVFSGDGYERNLNGSDSKSTSFAQPSGISFSPDLKELYIADSESSSVRALDLKTGGSRLLVGGDPIFPENLFKFGDHDGVGSEVLLQHPLGVYCAKDGQIYIADSYNHKIKKLDPSTRRVTTIAGTGKAGFTDGKAITAQVRNCFTKCFFTVGKLIIADTNNSVIRCLDLNKEEPELRTLELKGILPPASRSRSLKRLRRRASADTQIVKVDGVSTNEGKLLLRISLPEEYHFSKEARSKFTVDAEPEEVLSIDPSDGYLSPEGTAVLHYKRASSSVATGKIGCKVYYCKEDEVCLYQSLMFEIPFQEESRESTASEVTLAYLVRPKGTTGLQLPVAG
ncbi:unnamed protein product [Linum tenue]|uniref:Thioredoxin domain-containing protein n=1 Tax=Linum tenue TaxID=586396 RepID=A0AAV0MJF3_9ROSI|nr:unnamed protein product [Linum tenue]